MPAAGAAVKRFFVWYYITTPLSRCIRQQKSRIANRMESDFNNAGFRRYSPAGFTGGGGTSGKSVSQPPPSAL